MVHALMREQTEGIGCLKHKEVKSICESTMKVLMTIEERNLSKFSKRV